MNDRFKLFDDFDKIIFYIGFCNLQDVGNIIYISQLDLARKCGKTQPWASINMKKMVDNGYLEPIGKPISWQEHKKMGRAKCYKFTEKGLQGIKDNFGEYQKPIQERIALATTKIPDRKEIRKINFYKDFENFNRYGTVEPGVEYVGKS